MGGLCLRAGRSVLGRRQRVAALVSRSKALPPHPSSAVAYVEQHDSLLPLLTPREMLSYTGAPAVACSMLAHQLSLSAGWPELP